MTVQELEARDALSGLTPDEQLEVAARFGGFWQQLVADIMAEPSVRPPAVTVTYDLDTYNTWRWNCGKCGRTFASGSSDKEHARKQAGKHVPKCNGELWRIV